jgi:hypothetical protein
MISPPKRPVTAGRVFIVALSLLVACSGGDGPPVNDADMLRAQVLLAPFKSPLVEALTTAVADGPVHAIEFCNTKAPKIGAELSAGGVEMGRTSHKLRNPGNAPEPWMEPLLTDYVAFPDQRDPKAVRLSDGRVGYVEPIYVKPVCLTCHGDAVPDAVANTLAQLYPGDKATGFEAGEFRGMFWLKMPADTRASVAE